MGLLIKFMNIQSLKHGIGLLRGFLDFVLKKKPQFVNYDVTWSCNLNCEHCYWKKYSYGKKELTNEEWEDTLKKHRKEGMKYAMLTGGEPTLRENIIAMADKIFDAVFIVSNGTTRIPENINRRIFVSIDGNRETHNRIRRAPIFDKVIQNIKNDKRVVIAPTLSKTNFRQIEEIVKIAKDANVSGITFSLYTADNPDDSLLIKDADLDYVIQMLKKVKKENHGFVFLSSMMIDTFKTKAHIANCFLRSKFTISYYPDLTVKTPCVLGEKVDCNTCGCVVSIWMYCIRKLDVESAEVVGKMFSAQNL